jgi:hypothetical protein
LLVCEGGEGTQKALLKRGRELVDGGRGAESGRI